MMTESQVSADWYPIPNRPSITAVEASRLD
ncbi:hypothetical protein AU15_08530 [Marinobacter salarius]|uniref:Uncharacterized protein n=1 Tax=Marinobacter salarius TaxID=1420917 RepID=W5YV39_9GAMM|nr:hypothetical protein AU15_08530 [Marinobacter salarius]